MWRTLELEFNSYSSILVKFSTFSALNFFILQLKFVYTRATPTRKVRDGRMAVHTTVNVSMLRQDITDVQKCTWRLVSFTAFVEHALRSQHSLYNFVTAIISIPQLVLSICLSGPYFRIVRHKWQIWLDGVLLIAMTNIATSKVKVTVCFTLIRLRFLINVLESYWIWNFASFNLFELSYDKSSLKFIIISINFYQTCPKNKVITCQMLSP